MSMTASFDEWYINSLASQAPLSCLSLRGRTFGRLRSDFSVIRRTHRLSTLTFVRTFSQFTNWGTSLFTFIFHHYLAAGEFCQRYAGCAQGNHI
jgi:hypothetical protein